MEAVCVLAMYIFYQWLMEKKTSQLLSKALSIQLETSGLFCVQPFTQGICNSLFKLDF